MGTQPCTSLQTCSFDAVFSPILFFFLNLHRLLRFASHSMFQQCFTIICAVELKDESLNYMLKLNNPMDKTKDLRLPSMKHAMQECNQQQTLRWPGCYMLLGSETFSAPQLHSNARRFRS